VTALARARVLALSRGLRRAVLACGVLAALGCARESSPPNLVLISLDTTRADHLSVYGYPRETTPNLERLADGGVRFALAYAPAPTTGPSHATLFTGLHPITHRVVKNGRVLMSAHATLAERLLAHGWTTAGFVSSYVLDARFGWDQGFEHWDDDFDLATATTMVPSGTGAEVFDRTADATTRRALAWLEQGRDPSRPFFLFVHYMDPHEPWLAPPEFLQRFRTPDLPMDGISGLVARYDAEIAFTDHQIGELLAALDRLGLARNTIVAVSADHGEGLMQHGELNHGTQLYEEQVRVPLLMRWPRGLPAGRVVDGPVSLIDVTPTLLALAGVAPEPGDALQGRSLVPVMRGDQAIDPAQPLFLFRPDNTEIPGEQYAVREGDWKLVIGPGEGRELFDLARDPREREDRAAAQPERAAEMEERIRAWLREHGRPDVQPEQVSPEDLERLRALGYVP
jgi:arylsulfatase A-like enzyme